jgi:hypothetical protein
MGYRLAPARPLHIIPLTGNPIERNPIMSQANLVCSANTSIRPGPRSYPTAGVNNYRSAAERLLKEAAYVCHLTRAVRGSMMSPAKKIIP